mgnify:FL=1
MNFFIADTHIGCINKFENRTLEHDLLLKENWNKHVTNADDIWILGDLGRMGNNKDNEYLLTILSTLKGRKHLILGNHDDIRDLRIRQLFVEICEYKEIVDNFGGNVHHIVLSHYPILMWNGQHKEYIHLYGHVHDTFEEKMYQNALKELNNMFAYQTQTGKTDCPTAYAWNVGVMKSYMGYTPRTLKEIISANR